MPTIITLTRNSQRDNFAGLFDGGKIQVLTSTDTILYEFTLGTPGLTANGDGVATVAGLPLDATASASGTAAKAHLYNSAETHGIENLTVGTSAAHVIIDNTSVESGQTGNLTAASFTMPAGIKAP